ncbi:MAG: hypothetical protein K0A98_00965 [Trueperaceae bacterium]|nr:hypothetical protein [Trueperaceae bacterium]
MAARSHVLRTLALALLMVTVQVSAQAEPPTLPQAPAGDAWSGGPDLTIQEAMMHWTRSGDRSFTAGDGAAVHMSVDLTLAHPSFFRAGDREVPADVASGHEVVFLLTENIHYGDLPDAPTAFRLYVDDAGPYDAAEVELTNADPHHRTHRIVFRGAATTDERGAPIVDGETGSLALSAIGGERPLVLSWSLSESYLGAPPLNLASAEVIRVTATPNGFAPAAIELEAGRPTILVFDNPTHLEHHFHVDDLPIGDTMRWLVAVEGRDFGDDALRAAAQFDSHICDSEYGYCPTGAWVHLHANPGGEDAIAFVPQVAGTYRVSCPIHPNMTAEVVVHPAGHGH